MEGTMKKLYYYNDNGYNKVLRRMIVPEKEEVIRGR
jgi:hypothetical protein